MMHTRAVCCAWTRKSAAPDVPTGPPGGGGGVCRTVRTLTFSIISNEYAEYRCNDPAGDAARIVSQGNGVNMTVASQPG